MEVQGLIRKDLEMLVTLVEMEIAKFDVKISSFRKNFSYRIIRNGLPTGCSWIVFTSTQTTPYIPHLRE